MRKMSYLKKFFTASGIILGLFLTSSSLTTYAKPITPPSISADASVLIDADTGQVIYSKNADKKHFPASTTKVMTALVTLEHTNLNDIVKVGKNPPFAEGSSIGLKDGEEFTVEDLLTGLLLESGNDCALALAEHISGSASEFSKLMNKKALEIGCKNTSFLNPSGLPNPNHLTTAYDLALILKEAIKYDDFVRISRIMTKQLPASNLDGSERFVNNHNHLLNKNSSLYYEDALSGKSGYTEVARHTFVISAKKGDRTIIGSFLKAEDKNKNYADMKALLQYGFKASENIKLYSRDEKVEDVTLTKNSTLPLLIEKDFIFTKTSDSKDSEVTPKLSFDLPNDIKTKSFKKYDVVTTASVTVNGVEVGKVNLISGINREYNFFIGLKEFSINNPLPVALTIITILVILFIILKIISNKRDKIKRKAKWNELTKKKRKKSLSFRR